MRKLKSSGFAIVEVLLILVLIGTIGGVGWYVWHSKQLSDSSLNNASQNNLASLPAIKTFDDCQKAKGSKLQETYPEVCVTTSGKSFTNPDQQAVPKATTKGSKTFKSNGYVTYVNYDYSFSFKYPQSWVLTEKLEDAGRGGLEGNIYVTSPSGTKVHFGPDFGGKGGDCVDDQANDAHTTRTCTTRKIYSVEKLVNQKKQSIYLVQASDTAPSRDDGKTNYFIYLDSGNGTPKVGSILGAFIGTYDDVSVSGSNKFFYLTVYVEGKDDSKNNAKNFFNSNEVQEALPVLRSFNFI